MRVLLVGSGGREHALAWQLSKCQSVEQLYIAPGNPGMAKLNKVQIVKIQASQQQDLAAFVRSNDVDIVVVGPEQPLVDGLTECMIKAGAKVFGPSQYASQLEGSKAFSKAFMKKHNIPTADYQVFNNYGKAVAHIREAYSCDQRLVLKASGLAAGKGVLLPETEDEAVQGVSQLMDQSKFGAAGEEIVIEEYLEGEECSIFAMTDGYSYVLFPAAQDHKRVGEGDTGLNTGGMGAYCPAPCMTDKILKVVESEIIRPTIDGMRRDGHPFVGLLYVGLMLTKSGPKVLEYNCRFGDPETQAMMLMLDSDNMKSANFAQVLMACANGCLDSVDVQFKSGYAVSVVACSAGYPSTYEKGHVINVDHEKIQNVELFYAGVAEDIQAQLCTSGGRVLSVCAHGSTLKQALDLAYESMSHVHFKGMFYRKDIGWKALSVLHKIQNQSDKGEQSKSMSYKDSGVSIDNGNEFVNQIKSIVKSTRRAGSDSDIGGFGGVFDLSAAGFPSDCVLVSATDGVGTKLKLAHMMGRHDTIGIDLVAMNVNDLIVQGAEPLYFLDYFACGKLDLHIAKSVVSGIAKGCIQAGCALIGGETAEMPGMYQGEDYDLAGFTVGAVRPSRILPTKDIASGDVIVGLPSSGVHSNGYSLVRHILKENNVDYYSPAPFDGTKSIGEVLLTPTRIYIKQLLPLVQSGFVKGMAHITGGGFVDNIPRVLPSGLQCVLDANSWPLLPVFKYLMKMGNVVPEEMAKTFNCGIGMVLIVSPLNVDNVMGHFSSIGEEAYVIGQLQDMTSKSQDQVIIQNISAWNETLQ
ncbi:hypothetical protein MP228_002232 [Amoeboaphelidium protococcarum]|nr:hypothetical protein MP228_002232 [Amoeboaphelidium protococcarum]